MSELNGTGEPPQPSKKHLLIAKPEDVSIEAEGEASA